MTRSAELKIEKRSMDSFQKLLQSELQELSQSLLNLSVKSSRKEIHDLRVLTRRLRAVFAVMNSLEESEISWMFQKRLRKLTQVLGPVRSCDVCEKIVLERLPDTLADKAKAFEFVPLYLNENRKKLRSKLLKELKNDGLYKLSHEKLQKKVFEKSDLSNFGTALERKIKKSGMRLLKSWHHFRQKTSLSRLHEVRIDLKKWRYLLEIKKECLGVDLQEMLPEIRSLQDYLGNIHDLEVLQQSLNHKQLMKLSIKNKQKRDWESFLGLLESETEKQVAEFYREGEKYLVHLLPLRSL